MAITYTAIATTTVGAGGAANITFSSIPGTYTDLVVLFSFRSTRSLDEDGMQISLNSSTANFSFRRLTGNGSTASSSNAGNNTLGQLTAANTTASTFTNTFIYITNYTSSNNKSFSIDNVTEANATKAYAQLQASLWSDSSAITSIKLETDSSNNLAQYSSATLYGIKNTV